MKKFFPCAAVRRLAANLDAGFAAHEELATRWAIGRITSVLREACDEIDALRAEVARLQTARCTDVAHVHLRCVLGDPVVDLPRGVAVETRPGGAVILRCVARGCDRERPVGTPFCAEHEGEDLEEHW